MKIIGIIILLVIIIGAGYYCYHYLKNNPMNNSQIPVDFDKQKAIDIAEKELLKHYPNHKRAGGELKLISVDRVMSEQDAYLSMYTWFVKYDVPNTMDSSVEMTVDIKKGEVTYYKDAWS